MPSDARALAEAWAAGYQHGYGVGVAEGFSGKLIESEAPNPYLSSDAGGEHAPEPSE